ncbi:hypothetical protein COU15_00010 [Candidatus Kaiserbacteria bacterium CG10_big_fil_rev_8_21_14_0_10_45_20]|uniref:Uncharacterized protein n=1 Tax=Candidatus Kaiserbacteria bacterium CG10_big_fil_rev_8_21_14_0_10_45_20 TaxID=1974607 RepID=A0A2H0UGE0_9BACT|nr:MAG: hypothetical protein COU15_00010 [Candidatus Kaiserbacteria bacterium CG10_big_fil_rev_8_21_14_0_10_45_20]
MSENKERGDVVFLFRKDADGVGIGDYIKIGALGERVGRVLGNSINNGKRYYQVEWLDTGEEGVVLQSCAVRTKPSQKIEKEVKPRSPNSEYKRWNENLPLKEVIEIIAERSKSFKYEVKIHSIEQYRVIFLVNNNEVKFVFDDGGGLVRRAFDGGKKYDIEFFHALRSLAGICLKSFNRELKINARKNAKEKPKEPHQPRLL